jgi:mannose-6-phosphate isomerase-like protein (cupin superfamily)
VIAQDVQPRINARADSVFRFLGCPTTLRASAATTNGGFGLLEHVMPPGFASPYHVHKNEDEAFYVLEGEMAFVCDGGWMQAGAGTYVFGPRGIPHGFKVTGTGPARMLLLASPGGFEQFVVELSEPLNAAPSEPDMQKLVATAARFDIQILGPLPE